MTSIRKTKITKKQKISVGKDVEKLESLCTIGGNVKWWFLQKLKIELPYDPAIPLLGIYPKEVKAGS